MTLLEKLYLDAEEIESKIIECDDKNNEKEMLEFERQLNIIYRQIEEIEARDF